MSSSGNTMKSLYNDGIVIPNNVRFWIFLVSNILSLTCCLFVLIHFLFDSTLRYGLHNHAMIVVLFICLIWELTIVPWTMHVQMFDVAWIQSPTFCMIWKFLDTALYTSTAKLVGWASVERHILIFHEQWVATKKRRFLIHYVPLALIVVYGIVIYAVITPMNYCNKPFYYFVQMCGYSSCVYNSVGFTLYEYATGGLLCSVLIGCGSVSLILRVVRRKRHLQRQIQWRKHRKMTLQLLSVTSLFSILYLPPVILATAQRLGVPSYVGSTYSTYAQFFAFYIVFLFPFACINTLPQLRTRINKLLRCYRQQPAHRVVPLLRATKCAVNGRKQNHKTTAI